MRSLLILIVVLVFVALGTMFALNNTMEVPVDLIIAKMPPFYLGAWLIISFISGAALGLLFSTGIFLRLKNAERSARKQLKKSEQELDGLRSQALN